MKVDMRKKRGSNFIFVIVLLVLLGMLAAAFSSLAIYSSRTAASQKSYQSDYVMANSIRQSIVDSIQCSDVSSMKNPLVKEFVTSAQDGYKAYVTAYKDWLVQCREAEKNGTSEPEAPVLFSSKYVVPLYTNDPSFNPVNFTVTGSNVIYDQDAISTYAADTAKHKGFVSDTITAEDGSKIDVTTLIDYIPDMSEFSDDPDDTTATASVKGNILVTVEVKRTATKNGMVQELSHYKLGSHFVTNYASSGESGSGSETTGTVTKPQQISGGGGSALGGNIVATGDVTVMGHIYGSIISGGNVTLKNGSVVDKGVSASGNISGKGTVTNGVMIENAAAPEKPQIPSYSDPGDFSPIGKTGVFSAFSFSNNNAFAVASGIAPRAYDAGWYSGINAGITQLIENTGVTADQDLYYRIASDGVAGDATVRTAAVIKNLQLSGSKRLFLLIDSSVKEVFIQDTVGISGAESRLFLIGMGSSQVVHLCPGSTFNGQIYMPYGTVYISNNQDNGDNVYVNGIVTADVFDGAGWDVFYVKKIAGDYAGTSLEKAFDSVPDYAASCHSVKNGAIVYQMLKDDNSKTSLITDSAAELSLGTGEGFSDPFNVPWSSFNEYALAAGNHPYYGKFIVNGSLKTSSDQVYSGDFFSKGLTSTKTLLYNGDAYSAGDVSLNSSRIFNGSLHAGNPTDAAAADLNMVASEVDGDVFCTGKTVLNTVKINNGSLYCKGKAENGNAVTISGDVYCGGDYNMAAVVGGNLIAASGGMVRPGGEIKKSVYSGGDLDMHGTVLGNVYADGNISVENGINVGDGVTKVDDGSGSITYTDGSVPDIKGIVADRYYDVK